MIRQLTEKEINKCYSEINWKEGEEIVGADYDDETEVLNVYYIDHRNGGEYIDMYSDCSKEAIARILEKEVKEFAVQIHYSPKCGEGENEIIDYYKVQATTVEEAYEIVRKDVAARMWLENK